jgi:hypothetical protein
MRKVNLHEYWLTLRQTVDAYQEDKDAKTNYWGSEQGSSATLKADRLYRGKPIDVERHSPSVATLVGRHCATVRVILQPQEK